MGRTVAWLTRNLGPALGGRSPKAAAGLQEYLPVGEVTDAWRVHPNYVRALIRGPSLEARVVGREHRITPAAVEKAESAWPKAGPQRPQDVSDGVESTDKTEDHER